MRNEECGNVSLAHDNLSTQCRAIINVLVKPGGLADTTCPASSKDCKIARLRRISLQGLPLIPDI
jgi:hypothetical protein